MQYPGYNSNTVKLLEGKFYTFKIHNLVRLQDDAYYFVLLDINGMKHFIPAAFYEHYGLSKGNEIICKIDKINCTGRIILEPLHPVYREGEVYNFDIAETPVAHDKHAIFVKDVFNNCIEAKVNDHRYFEIAPQSCIKCSIISLKKGRPELEVCTQS